MADRVRSPVVVATLLGVLTLLVALTTWGWVLAAPGDPAVFSDTLDYLRFADMLRASWSGDVPQDLRDFYAVTRFPPLYPFLLSATGAGLDAPTPAYWLGAVLALAGLALAWFWYRRSTGSVIAASMLALVLALNPGLLLLTLSPHSEALYLPLCLLSFCLAERVRMAQTDVFVFVLTTSLLPICRSAGLALCAAAAVWLWLAKISTPRRRFVLSSLLFAPALLWAWSRAGLPIQLDYASELHASTLIDRLGGAEGLLWQRPRALGATLVSLLTGPSMQGPVTALAALLLALAALGACLRAKARSLEVIYACVYLALCFIWPYPAELPRLLAMLVPLVLLWTWIGAQALATRARAASADVVTSVLVGACAVVACAPFLVEAAVRCSMPVDRAMASFLRRTDYVSQPDRARAVQATRVAAGLSQAMQRVAQFVPNSACVYTIAPQMLWYHSGRRVDARALPYPWPGGVARHVLSECEFVLVSNTGSAQLGQHALYPLAELTSAAHVEFVVYADTAKSVPAAALLRLK
jgi:hypothetical protein